MYQILTFLQNSASVILLIINSVTVGLIIHVIHKMNQIKQTVGTYLSVVMEEETNQETSPNKSLKEKEIQQEQKEEEQHRLISAVLQEYFP